MKHYNQCLVSKSAELLQGGQPPDLYQAFCTISILDFFYGSTNCYLSDATFPYSTFLLSSPSTTSSYCMKS